MHHWCKKIIIKKEPEIKDMIVMMVMTTKNRLSSRVEMVFAQAAVCFSLPHINDSTHTLKPL
jgi:hypothetical protein